MEPASGQHPDVEEGQLSGEEPSYPPIQDSVPTHNPNLHLQQPPQPAADSEEEYIFETVHQQHPDKRKKKGPIEPRNRPHNMTPNKDRRPHEVRSSDKHKPPGGGYYPPPPYMMPPHGDNPNIPPYPPPPGNYMGYGGNNQNYYPPYPPHGPYPNHNHHYTNIQYKIPLPLQPTRRNNSHPKNNPQQEANYPPPPSQHSRGQPEHSYHNYPPPPPSQNHYPPQPQYPPHNAHYQHHPSNNRHHSSAQMHRRAYMNAIRRQILKNIEDFGHPQCSDIIETIKCILKFQKIRKTAKGQGLVVAQECYERSLRKVEGWVQGNDLNVREFMRGLLDAVQMKEVFEKINQLKIQRQRREESGRSEMKRMVDLLVRHPKKMIF